MTWCLEFDLRQHCVWPSKLLVGRRSDGLISVTHACFMLMLVNNAHFSHIFYSAYTVYSNAIFYLPFLVGRRGKER